MARTRMVRAFSAGGVVFRVVPTPLPHSSISSISSNSSASASPTLAAPGDASTSSDSLANVEIALVGRTHTGIWALPKGTPRLGERVPETALREVREETGLITRVVGDLGSIFYTFTRARIRYHKEVAHFLLEAVGGDISLHDAEYDEVRWFPLDEAPQRLTFANDAEVVRRAIPLLQRRLTEHATAPGRTSAPSATPTAEAATAVAQSAPPAGGAAG